MALIYEPNPILDEFVEEFSAMQNRYAAKGLSFSEILIYFVTRYVK